MNNIRVYALAEYYSIPDLKNLAFTKFNGRVKNGSEFWDDEDFVELVQAIYGSTPPKDTMLRRKISQEASKYRKRMTEDEDFMSAAGDIPQFLQDFTHQVVAACKREIVEHSNEAMEQHWRLEEKLRETETSLKLANERSRSLQVKLSAEELQHTVANGRVNSRDHLLSQLSKHKCLCGSDKLKVFSRHFRSAVTTEWKVQCLDCKREWQ